MTPCPVPYMQGGVDRYLEHGIQPGRFLTALFAHDIRKASRCADDTNSALMREWVRFMISEVPVETQGSPERVAAWIKQHRQRRGEAA